VHGDREDLVRCQRAGCDDVLVKPVRPETLINVIALRLASGVETGAFGFQRSVLSARGVREGVERLAAGFAEQLPERASALEGAIAAGDVDEVSALAHRLKGTAGAYGFDGIAEEAAALHADVSARATLDRVRDRVARVADLCRRAATARLPIWRHGSAPD
jgi:HPt (histidine-containing phosphotransfer) domain-containing protein